MFGVFVNALSGTYFLRKSFQVQNPQLSTCCWWRGLFSQEQHMAFVRGAPSPGAEGGRGGSRSGVKCSVKELSARPSCSAMLIQAMPCSSPQKEGAPSPHQAGRLRGNLYNRFLKHNFKSSCHIGHNEKSAWQLVRAFAYSPAFQNKLILV